MIVGYVDTPASHGRPTGGRDIAAKAHEHATTAGVLR